MQVTAVSFEPLTQVIRKKIKDICLESEQSGRGLNLTWRLLRRRDSHSVIVVFTRMKILFRFPINPLALEMDI